MAGLPNRSLTNLELIAALAFNCRILNQIP